MDTNPQANSTSELGSANALFREMQKVMPGGVNSPVRSFAAAGSSDPVIAASAAGACIKSIDGKEYVDFIHGWGSIAAGHAHPEILEAVSRASQDGTCFGIPTQAELEYAQALCDAFGLEKIRAVCSGTEAAMTAIRLARGCTGRNLLVKFAGCYHGHADALLVQAGSGALTFGTPSSAGVPEATVADTLVLSYNDPQALRDAFASHGEKIAAVILEPVAGNMNLIIPQEDFIAEARAQCTNYGSILIADEIMCGMRASASLAIRDIYSIEPDLACLGKIIGGGMPIAAFGGRKELMDQLAPTGNVYQAGTLAGNPLAIAAGLAQMKIMQRSGSHVQLEQAARTIADTFASAAAKADIAFAAQHIGGMIGLYFASSVPQHLEEAASCDKDAFQLFHAAMLNEGVLLPPSMFEAAFIGLAHNEQIVAAATKAAENAFGAVTQ